MNVNNQIGIGRGFSDEQPLKPEDLITLQRPHPHLLSAIGADCIIELTVTISGNGDCLARVAHF